MGRNILIVGPSGRGKSTSLRNLPVKFTKIMNSERKALPFKGGNKFNQTRVTCVADIFNWFENVKADKSSKICAIDSFSACVDIIKGEAETLYKGFDVWNWYNKQIYQFFQQVKALTDSNRYVIITGHDELVDEDGSGVRRLKVKGNEWKGVLEKEFDVVFYAETFVEEEGKPSFKFRTQTNGQVPAKTPMGMFEDILIDNDMADIIKAIAEYDK
jgi:hypothetical protein